MPTRVCWPLSLGLAIAFMAVGPRAQSPANPPSVTTLLEASRARHNIPALAMVATRSDTVLEVAAVGIRRAGVLDRVTPADRFHIGSNVKAITATMLATLVEEGDLGWDTTPSAVFTEARDRILPDYRDVTLTDLLAHRAGLPAYDDTDSPEFHGLPPLTPGTALEQRRSFTFWVLAHKPTGAPRTKRLYSNAGYAIAAALAERVTGQSWESLMSTRLLQPLGVEATFEWPAFDDPAQPWGHYETKNDVRPQDPNGDYQLPAFLAPAGALSISPGDYAKFPQLHLRGLRDRNDLLKAETIKRLHTRVDEKTGLGWGVQQFEGALASVHSGSGGTFYAVVAVWPSRDLAVAVFANAGGERADAASVEVLKSAAHCYDPG